MYYCLKCKTLLEYIGKDAGVLCGAVSYYKCPDCGTIWQNDQGEIIASPANLTEVPEYEIDFVMESIEHP